MGMNNFGGKKAAPFTRGGSRSERVARARKSLAKVKSRKDLSRADERVIDLDWAAWNKAHKKAKSAAPATKPAKVKAPKPAAEVAAFKKANKGANFKAAVTAKAAQPGHLRAKAIKAALNGNTKRANKIEQARTALRQAKQNAGVPKGVSNAAAKPLLQKRAAMPGNRTAKAAVAALNGHFNKADRLAPKPPAPPKPKAARPPAMPKAPVAVKVPKVAKPKPLAKPNFATQAKANKAHAKAVRKSMALSNVDLAHLDAAARKALPSSAFVFPGKRAYPIPDKAHAENALARSEGKPEHAAVVAAVKRRFPNLPYFKK